MSFYLLADDSTWKKNGTCNLYSTVHASKLYIILMDLAHSAHEPFWIRHTSVKIMFHHHRTIVEYLQSEYYRPNTITEAL